MKTKEKIKTKCLHFYGSYFIGYDELDEYWMVDIPNHKLRPIDKDCFGIIELLSDIKNDLKDL